MDVFKIITNVFNKFTGTCLLTLYDLISLLSENFEEYFRNEALSSELIKCVVKKWYEIIILNQTTSENYNINLTAIFDMIISLVKVAGCVMTLFINDFLSGTLEILKKNYDNYISANKDLNFLDKDLITKCFDLFSNIYTALPVFMINYPMKNSIVEFVFKFLDINENYLNHYAIALLGDIGRVDNMIFKENIKYIINLLIKNLDLPPQTKAEPLEMEKLSVCNNSSWTIGILATSYPDTIKEFIHQIMKKLTKIISLPRVKNFLIISLINP